MSIPPLPRDFAEAMSLTGGIKSKFKNNPEDIYHRGYRLVRESVACGVTSTRAHVEVDASVELICLEAALRLKHTFRDVCDIQIAGELCFLMLYPLVLILAW